MSFASKEIIDVLNKIKPPYNITMPTQQLALQAIDAMANVNKMIKETVAEREVLMQALKQLPMVEKVFPSDANFLLVKIKNATAVYNYLKENGIIVRNRSSVILCENCLRITVGTETQNEELINKLSQYKSI